MYNSLATPTAPPSLWVRQLSTSALGTPGGSPISSCCSSFSGCPSTFNFCLGNLSILWFLETAPAHACRHIKSIRRRAKHFALDEDEDAEAGQRQEAWPEPAGYIKLSWHRNEELSEGAIARGRSAAQPFHYSYKLRVCVRMCVSVSECVCVLTGNLFRQRAGQSAVAFWETAAKYATHAATTQPGKKAAFHCMGVANSSTSPCHSSVSFPDIASFLCHIEWRQQWLKCISWQKL